MRHILTALVALAMLISACKKEKKSLASITTNAASSITSTSVQSGGNITNDGGSAITQRGVCWATHAEPTVADSITNNGTGGRLIYFQYCRIKC